MIKLRILKWEIILDYSDIFERNRRVRVRQEM